MTDAGPLEDPRRERQRVLATYLRVALGVAFVLALAGTVLPEDSFEPFARAMVVVLVAAPIGRVLWLLVRWTKRGDRRFAAAAAGLLAVMTVALLLA
jgi:hypothetical protein